MTTLEPGLTSEISRRLVAEFDPDLIILFGSHAWGSPHRDSDVDILVVVPGADETDYARAVRAHRCLRGIPLPMDLIVRSHEEFDRMAGVPTSLESRILERGRILYGRGGVGDGEELASEGVA